MLRLFQGGYSSIIIQLDVSFKAIFQETLLCFLLLPYQTIRMKANYAMLSSPNDTVVFCLGFLSLANARDDNKHHHLFLGDTVIPFSLSRSWQLLGRGTTWDPSYVLFLLPNQTNLMTANYKMIPRFRTLANLVDIGKIYEDHVIFTPRFPMYSQLVS